MIKHTQTIRQFVLVAVSYPQNSSVITHMESIGKMCGSVSANYENFIWIGNFSATEFDTSVEFVISVISTVLKKIDKKDYRFQESTQLKMHGLNYDKRIKKFFEEFLCNGNRMVWLS